MQMKLINRPDYMNRLRELRDHHLIKVVTGVRRCGKSTLLEMFADELRVSGVTEGQIQFYNFEDPDVYSIGDWKQIYDHIKVRLLPDKMNYLFLDEVQNIDTFERLVDGLFIKKNCDVYVTGSNAMLLSGELATLLTGRYLQISIQPFSFAEYSRALAAAPKPQNNIDSESYGDLHIESMIHNSLTGNKSLYRYLFEGGMPQAVELRQTTTAADDFLNGIIDTIVERDIFQRHEIYTKPTFQKVIDFAMDSVGSLVSSASIAGTLKNDGIAVDRKTVVQYLDYLSSAFLLYKVPRYDVKGKNLLRTLEKYYLSDTGFRRARLKREAETDLGHLLENVVYLELRRRYKSVFVGKWNEHEIDFVTTDWQGYTSYYQVALTAFGEEALERELRPLLAVRDSNMKFLLTTDLDGNPVFDGIRKLNVVDWLLRIDG
ncbi:MAG: ATP-binding protein [Coriobacteriales bacterium]|nr:ATP-binding protein [Coriobacteriales bacterium]